MRVLLNESVDHVSIHSNVSTGSTTGDNGAQALSEVQLHATLIILELRNNLIKNNEAQSLYL
ncbi:hypothetical protein BG003_001084, partial [Podila horticola]